MKTLALALFISVVVLEGNASACDRNKIDNSTMLSNNKGNYFTVMNNSKETKSPAATSSNTGSRRH